MLRPVDDREIAIPVQPFGKDVPIQRSGPPEEVASCDVFLAGNGALHMTGQILHPNGGTLINR